MAQREEWEIALLDHPQITASYDQPDLTLVRDLGTVYSPDGDAEVLPGVRVFSTGGHSAGHQGVLVVGPNRSLAFFGDLAMRPWSVSPGWTTSFDDYPLDSVAVKQELFRRAVEEEWIVALSHERQKPIGRIERVGGRYQFAPI